MIKTFVTGNVTHNPELRTTDSGKNVTTLRVASNRVGKDGADFLSIEVWGTQAEACCKYLKKGSGIAAAGDLFIDTYEKDDGKRISVKLINAQVEFTDRAPKETNNE